MVVITGVLFLEHVFIGYMPSKTGLLLKILTKRAGSCYRKPLFGGLV